ncbi:MAG: chromate transporter [bacterium]|nr:chromate transporter [bacterium]
MSAGILWQLFVSFLQIGLFSIGGGYAAMPLIQSQVVELHGWLTLEEFTDLVTIAEMTPGPIAVNSATFVGTQIAGVEGAVLATFGCILPSCIIVSILARLYYKYKGLSLMQGILASLRPAVVAMIASAGLTILIMVLWGESGFQTELSQLNVLGAVIFLGALLLLRKYKCNPILVMVLAGVVNLVVNVAMKGMSLL